MAEEFRREGDPRFELALDDLDAFFEHVERFAAGRNLPDDRVQQTHFLLFDRDRLVGSARLRHRLIPVLHLDGGNVGYEIRRAERGKGYGTTLLALVLAEACRIGLDRVLLTTERQNLPSIRVIEKNGGVPDGTSISPNTGEVMLRYWIEVPR
jgi:predicted acetyltransferase